MESYSIIQRILIGGMFCCTVLGLFVGFWWVMNTTTKRLCAELKKLSSKIDLFDQMKKLGTLNQLDQLDRSHLKDKLATHLQLPEAEIEPTDEATDEYLRSLAKRVRLAIVTIELREKKPYDEDALVLARLAAQQEWLMFVWEVKDFRPEHNPVEEYFCLMGRYVDCRSKPPNDITEATILHSEEDDDAA